MKRVLFLLLACLLLSGCANRKVEEELLVIVLAVDQTEQNDVTVAVKVPSISSAAGKDGQESGGDQSGYMLLEATGHSFTDALSMLNATTPRQLNFSQAREIVIGDAMARRTDFATLLRQIDALPRFRCSAAVIICTGQALDFAKEQKPYVGMRLSRYTENTLSNYAGKGFTPSTTLCDGVRDLGYGFQDPLFILGAVNDFSSVQEPDGSNSLSTQAGHLPRKSLEAVELFGAAATNGVCVCGTLTGYEMALLHLLSGHVEALLIQEGGVSIHVTAMAPAALGVDLSRRPIRLTVSVLCEALYPPGDTPDGSAVRNRLENDIQAVIAHLQEMQCDGIGFGNVAVRQFLTVSDWEALHWREEYAQAEVEVTLAVQMREN